MDRRLDNRNEPNKNQDNSYTITTTNLERIQTTHTGSPRSSFFSMFRRTRSKTEDSTGFINKQIPAYWHGK
jgi:hypothetical protein